MLGFVAAIGAELSTHKGLLQQLSIAPLSIGATFLVFTGDKFLSCSDKYRNGTGAILTY